MSGYLDELAETLHEDNKRNGFWNGEVTHDKVVAKICLIHEEVSELTQEYRTECRSEELSEELADIIIRCLDLYQALKEVGYIEDSLHEAIISKLEKNRGRGYLHGKNYG